jgi:hypothetical protein
MSKAGKGVVVLLLVAVGAAGAASFASNAPSERERTALGPMAERLKALVGVWRVEARLQLTPTARPVTIAAVQENKLIGGRWLVSEFKDLGGGPDMPPFEGIGINGFDPEKRTYSGIWVDGSRGFVVPVEGTYDEARKVFRTTSTERQRDGRTVTVISETRAISANEEETVFTAPDEAGRPYVRMVLHATRRP